VGLTAASSLSTASTDSDADSSKPLVGGKSKWRVGREGWLRIDSQRRQKAEKGGYGHGSGTAHQGPSVRDSHSAYSYSWDSK
jgi:hypothetical protein